MADPENFISKGIFLGIHVWPEDQFGRCNVVYSAFVKREKIATSQRKTFRPYLTKFRTNVHHMGVDISEVVKEVNQSFNVVNEYRAASIVIVHQDDNLVVGAQQYIEDLKTQFYPNAVFPTARIKVLLECSFYATITDCPNPDRMAVVRGIEFSYFYGRHPLAPNCSTPVPVYSREWGDITPKIFNMNKEIRFALQDETGKPRKSELLHLIVAGVFPRETTLQGLLADPILTCPENRGIKIHSYYVGLPTDEAAAGYACRLVDKELLAPQTNHNFVYEPRQP